MNNPTAASPSSADPAGAGAASRRVVVEAWRGDGVESRHEVWCAVVPATALGSAHVPGLAPAELPARTFMRSTAKPFQLLPLVVAGGIERFALEAADLAVMAASHDGTDAHAQRVAAILERMHLRESALRCGVHRPYFLDTLPPQHPERQRIFGPLHNNCSGNHAALLGLGLRYGVPPERYLDPAGAGQARAHDAVEAACGLRPALAVDDCGAPCYAVPLAALAHAYRCLARPDVLSDFAGERRARFERVGSIAAVIAGLGAIATAMAREPEWVSGASSGATRLARALPDTIVAKYGAEGVLCVAHRARGEAVALKVVDGTARALMPALLVVARALDWLPAAAEAALADLAEPVLTGRTGQVIGRLRVAC